MLNCVKQELGTKQASERGQTLFVKTGEDDRKRVYLTPKVHCVDESFHYALPNTVRYFTCANIRGAWYFKGTT